jgi:hypothetical protein
MDKTSIRFIDAKCLKKMAMCFFDIQSSKFSSILWKFNVLY